MNDIFGRSGIEQQSHRNNESIRVIVRAGKKAACLDKIQGIPYAGANMKLSLNLSPRARRLSRPEVWDLGLPD
jgi:hypothetical protein